MSAVYYFVGVGVTWAVVLAFALVVGSLVLEYGFALFRIARSRSILRRKGLPLHNGEGVWRIIWEGYRIGAWRLMWGQFYPCIDGVVVPRYPWQRLRREAW